MIFIRTSSTDEMTTLIHTTTYVTHMEPDLHVPGNILFSEYYALRTTDGETISTIAGSTSSSGNIVAVGQRARFGQMSGFRQISSTHVVVVDHIHSCLRLVSRITLQTSWYAGYCGGNGYSQGTTSARFRHPLSVIDDQKRPGMLLASDRNNNAIRHIRLTAGSGLCSVSQFFQSSSIDKPMGLTQDPFAGGVYITTATHRVFKLTYTTRFLTFLSGSTSRGFANGDFGSSRFYYPFEVLLIDNGQKLVLADNSNSRLRVLDLINRRSSSICSGSTGHYDSDMSTCTLWEPRSLMVLNKTMYVGEKYRIRKLQGKEKVCQFLIDNMSALFVHKLTCELLSPEGTNFTITIRLISLVTSLHTYYEKLYPCILANIRQAMRPRERFNEDV